MSYLEGTISLFIRMKNLSKKLNNSSKVRKERDLEVILKSPINRLRERNPCEAISFPVPEVPLNLRQAETVQKMTPT